jgi:hypothetical protein
MLIVMVLAGLGQAGAGMAKKNASFFLKEEILKVGFDVYANDSGCSGAIDQSTQRLDFNGENISGSTCVNVVLYNSGVRRFEPAMTKYYPAAYP